MGAKTITLKQACMVRLARTAAAHGPASWCPAACELGAITAALVMGHAQVMIVHLRAATEA